MPPLVVMQQTGERNLNRSKPLKSNIISQSEHTIKISNGVVLRKSGAALERTITPKSASKNWKLLANKPSSSKGTTGTYQNTAGKKTKRSRIIENEEN